MQCTNYTNHSKMTERQRDIQTQRHRVINTERQRDKEMERQRDRETDRQRDKYKENCDQRKGSWQRCHGFNP